jgi:hypothetical protein
MDYKKYFDRYSVGIILSVLSPSIIFLIFFADRFTEYKVLGDTFSQFLYIVLPVAISRCIFPNIIFFIIFISAGYYKAVKGVLYTSLTLTALLFILKYLF